MYAYLIISKEIISNEQISKEYANNIVGKQ